MALAPPTSTSGSQDMPPPPSYNQALTSKTPIAHPSPKHCMRHSFELVLALKSIEPHKCIFCTRTRTRCGVGLCRPEHNSGHASGAGPLRECRTAHGYGGARGRSSRSADDGREHRVAHSGHVLQLPPGGHHQHG